MSQAVKKSEETYMREQEQARDEHLRSVRQTDRSDYNYFVIPANSTPIRNDNTRTDPPGVHFNMNPIHHIYSTASNKDDLYKPLVNESIIQTAASALADQLKTNTTSATGRNDPWRCNSGATTATAATAHRMPTDPTSHNDLHNNISPNSSDNRNGPYASDVENKVISDQHAERGFSATIARPTTMVQRHVENNITTSQAPPTVKSLQDTT